MNSLLSGAAADRGPDTSIVVVAIASIPQLRDALVEIERQTRDASCEIVVAADQRIGSLDAMRAEFPRVDFLSDHGSGTPVDLATLALRHVKGERIILTEDSCVAEAGWFSNLVATESRGRAAVGGSVLVSSDLSVSMWAFAYVDFFRYMPPVSEGKSPSLSVCNVMYLASDLRAIEHVWRDGFHETNVHQELASRFGDLWLNPRAAVTVRRTVALTEAIYERYAFGRLFGATRIARSGAAQRVGYSVASPALPFLLFGRMSAKAARDARLLGRFARSLPMTLAMVGAWSWGEFLGYATKRLPSRTSTARQLPEEGDASGDAA